MNITIQKQDRQIGPFTVEEVNRHLREGTLKLDDWAWWEGTPDWVPLRSIEGICDIPSSAPVAVTLVPRIPEDEPVMPAVVKPQIAGAPSGEAVAKKRFKWIVIGIAIVIVVGICNSPDAAEQAKPIFWLGLIGFVAWLLFRNGALIQRLLPLRTTPVSGEKPSVWRWKIMLPIIGVGLLIIWAYFDKQAKATNAANAFRIRARVIQVTETGLLVIAKQDEPSFGVGNSTGNGGGVFVPYQPPDKHGAGRPKEIYGNFFVFGHPKQATLVDDAEIDVDAYQDGVVSYTTAIGAQRTVKKYTVVKAFE
jgi:hypothetical protein